MIQRAALAFADQSSKRGPSPLLVRQDSHTTTVFEDANFSKLPSLDYTAVSDGEVAMRVPLSPALGSPSAIPAARRPEADGPVAPPTGSRPRRPSWLATTIADEGARLKELPNLFGLTTSKLGLVLADQRRLLHNVASLLAVLAILFAIVDVECYTKYERGDEYPSIILRGCVTALSVTLCFLTYKETSVRHREMAFQRSFFLRTNLWTAGLVGPMLLEMALCLAHLPPAVRFTGPAEYAFTSEGSGTSEYNEAALAPLVFLRVFTVFKTVRGHSYVYRHGGRFLNRSNGVPITMTYVFRASMAKRPLTTVALLLAFAVSMFAYTLLIYERPFAGPDYGFPAALWNVFIAMTTVGFGDVFPYSYPGRAIIAVSVWIGLVLFAFLTGVFVEKARLQGPELRVVSTLRSSSLRRRYRTAAAVLVQRVWRWQVRARRIPGVRERGFGQREVEALEEWSEARYAYRLDLAGESDAGFQNSDVVLDRVARGVLELRAGLLDLRRQERARGGGGQPAGPPRSAADEDEFAALNHGTPFRYVGLGSSSNLAGRVPALGGTSIPCPRLPRSTPPAPWPTASPAGAPSLELPARAASRRPGLARRPGPGARPSGVLPHFEGGGGGGGGGAQLNGPVVPARRVSRPVVL
eukprot:tig00000157_g9660.t1